MFASISIAVVLIAGVAETEGSPNVVVPAGASPTGAAQSEPSVHPSSAPPVSLPAISVPRSPGVELALRSAPDVYGVPQALYALDHQLEAHRQMIEAACRSRRAGGVNAILVGGVGLAMSALLFWRANSNADAAEQARQRGDIVIRDPSDMQYTVGVVTGLMGLGFVGYGASRIATKPDPTLLQAYFRETYPSRTLSAQGE